MFAYVRFYAQRPHLNVKLENLMTYALVGGMEVPSGTCGYKWGWPSQNQSRKMAADSNLQSLALT